MAAQPLTNQDISTLHATDLQVSNNAIADTTVPQNFMLKSITQIQGPTMECENIGPLGIVLSILYHSQTNGTYSRVPTYGRNYAWSSNTNKK